MKCARCGETGLDYDTAVKVVVYTPSHVYGGTIHHVGYYILCRKCAEEMFGDMEPTTEEEMDDSTYELVTG